MQFLANISFCQYLIALNKTESNYLYAINIYIYIYIHNSIKDRTSKVSEMVDSLRPQCSSHNVRGHFRSSPEGNEKPSFFNFLNLNVIYDFIR